MAINKNHEFEELNGVKCAIVEKNVSQERADFLKDILGFNKYTVIVVPAAPPKAVPRPAGETTGEPEATAPPPSPATFTIGVTDVRFNPTNAIFGRMLKTRDGRIVTLAYWQQKESIANDEIPYYQQPV